MTFERFQKIMCYNQKHQREVDEYVNSFYARAGMNKECDFLNVMVIVRPLFQREGYLVMELPFTDREIGALCYKSDGMGYIFFNSNLPKVNVNFALCHEIYHVFYQKEPFRIICSEEFDLKGMEKSMMKIEFVRKVMDENMKVYL